MTSTNKTSASLEQEVGRLVARHHRDMWDGPDNLLAAVEARTATHRFSWYQRLMFTLRSPLRISISPLTAVPGGIAAIGLLLVAVFFAGRATSPGAITAASPAAQQQTTQLAAASSAATTVTAMDTVQVEFNAVLPKASTVAIVGSFNNWSSKGSSMQFDKERGVWTITMTLKPGRHEYGFLVDGSEVVPDDYAPLQTTDDFGNRNSVLVVGGDYEQAV